MCVVTGSHIASVACSVSQVNLHVKIISQVMVSDKKHQEKNKTEVIFEWAAYNFNIYRTCLDSTYGIIFIYY